VSDSDMRAESDRPISPRNGSVSIAKFLDIAKTLSALATPLFLLLFGYLVLAEDQRARRRWEDRSFELAVNSIVDKRLDTIGLATKADVKLLQREIEVTRHEVQKLDDQMRPILSYLIKKGIID